MAASSISRVFVIGLMAAAFVVMLLTAGLHTYAVLSLGGPEQVERKMIGEPPSGQQGQEGADGINLNDAQMAEVSELMARLKDNPNDSATLTALGDAFLKAGDWTRAEFFLSRAVLAKPADIRPRYMLGIAMHQQGKLAETVKTFEELIAIEEDPSSMYNLAVIYKYQAKDPKRAEELFKKVVSSPKAGPDVVEKAKKELE